jgi:hypothetical protein
MDIDEQRKKEIAVKEEAVKKEHLKQRDKIIARDGRRGVHPSIRDLPEDHWRHWKKVKQWIKYQEGVLRSIRSQRKSKRWQERDEVRQVELYIYNMKRYLVSGVWLDYRYGEEGDKRVSFRCIKPAFDKDGVQKRTVGVWYDDVGRWTKELEELYNE